MDLTFWEYLFILKFQGVNPSGFYYLLKPPALLVVSAMLCVTNSDFFCTSISVIL